MAWFPLSVTQSRQKRKNDLSEPTKARMKAALLRARDERAYAVCRPVSFGDFVKKNKKKEKFSISAKKKENRKI